MSVRHPTVSFFGIALGGIALIMAVVHFWAGPFAPQKSVERTVAETAVAIRDATVAALRGEEVVEQRSRRNYDIDAILQVVTSVLGGIAIVVGVFAVAKGEPFRAAGGAAFLGGAAIAFQFMVVALGMIVLAILVSAVISELDFF